MTNTETNMPHDILRRAAIAVLPVVATSFLGQLATYPNLAPWYEGLGKPSFNPPNWVFAPVWTALYALMAYAAWRVLKLPRATPGRPAALTLFFVQLALNAAWPWLFFGFNSPLAGLLNIVPQWLVIVATIDRVRLLDRIATWCLVPLAAWVAFASVLNFEIWRLNGWPHSSWRCVATLHSATFSPIGSHGSPEVKPAFSVLSHRNALRSG